MNLFRKLSKIFCGGTTEEKQTFFLYCPKCNNELCSSNSFISDTEDGVNYVCSKCGHASSWNFDMGPFALEIKGVVPTPREMHLKKCPECGHVHE